VKIGDELLRLSSTQQSAFASVADGVLKQVPAHMRLGGFTDRRLQRDDGDTLDGPLLGSVSQPAK
jgi:hypothetical protein